MTPAQQTALDHHVRRRLTTAEDALIGPAVDCRGTPEAARRFFAMQKDLPSHAISMAADELSQ